MSRGIRILWVEDHLLLRDALASLLKQSREFNLHAVVDSSLEAERILQRDSIDLLLLDLTLQHENTMPKIASWRTQFPSVNILVLSATNNPSTIRQALDSGAIGFVSKLDPVGDLLTALRRAARKSSFVSQRVKGPGISRGHDLSRREEEVLREIAGGKPVRDIARRLGISPKTVERHKENLKLKLNLENAPSLLREAMRLFPGDSPAS